MMTAHPSATGVLLSLLEPNQKLSPSIMHHFSLLFFCLFFFSIFLSTHFVEYFIFVKFSLVRVCCECVPSADKQPKLSSRVCGRGEVEGTGYAKRAQEIVLVGKQKVTTQGNG